MLLREVTRLTEWVETADEYPEKEVDAVLRDIHAHAASLDRADLVELHAAVGRLMAAVRDQEERLRDRLGDMKRGQRAMRGYGYLRSSQAGQRLRRKA